MKAFFAALRVLARYLWLSIRQKLFQESPAQKVERMLYQTGVRLSIEDAKARSESTPKPRFPPTPQSGRWIDFGFKADKDSCIIKWGTSRNDDIFRSSPNFSNIFYGIPKCKIVFNFEDECESPFNDIKGLTNVVVMTYPSTSEALSIFEVLRERLIENLGSPDSTVEISFWCVPPHTGLIWDSPHSRASLHIGDFKGECPMAEFRVRRKRIPELEAKQERLIQENIVSRFDIQAQQGAAANP